MHERTKGRSGLTIEFARMTQYRCVNDALTYQLEPHDIQVQLKGSVQEVAKSILRPRRYFEFKFHFSVQNIGKF